MPLLVGSEAQLKFDPLAVSHHFQVHPVRLVDELPARPSEMLGQSPMICTVPEVLAERWEAEGRLAARPAPVELPRFTVSLIWHARRDGDPALRWLRGQVAALASGV